MYRTVRGNRARGSTNKLTRKISTFGIMGGLVPQRGLPAPLSRHINTKSIGQIVIPSKPVDGLFYMEGNNPMNKYLLSKNPVGSGGVGNMIPNIPCCSAGTLEILRPKPANLTDIDNSNVGITPPPQEETCTNDEQLQNYYVVFRHDTSGWNYYNHDGGSAAAPAPVGDLRGCLQFYTDSGFPAGGYYYCPLFDEQFNYQGALLISPTLPGFSLRMITKTSGLTEYANSSEEPYLHCVNFILGVPTIPNSGTNPWVEYDPVPVEITQFNDC